MKDRLLIYNARLVDRDRDIKKGAILIEGKRIAGFPTKDAVKKMMDDPKVSKFDARGNTVLPSFVDMHVHIRARLKRKTSVQAVWRLRRVVMALWY